MLKIIDLYINIKQVGLPLLYKGTVLTDMKFIVGVLMGLTVAKICGDNGILGINPMVMIAAIKPLIQVEVSINYKNGIPEYINLY